MLYTLDKKLKKENSFYKYFLKYFFMTIKSILLALALTIIIALIIGFRPIIINGGSMLPTLDYNDIIVVYKPAQNEFKVGDILTYQFGKNGPLVTHRIIEIDKDGYFFTQGDNPNNSADEYPISYNYEEGKPTVVGKTYYALRVTGQIVHWLMIIPNLISLIAGVFMIYGLNKATREFCDKNVDSI